MDEVELIVSMERVLAELYPDKRALEALLYRARITLPGLDLDGAYNAALNRCLRMVKSVGKLDNFIRAAMDDYKDNRDLQRFATEIVFSEKPFATSAKELGKFLNLLRQCRHLTRRELRRLDDKLQTTFNITAMEESDLGSDDSESSPWDELHQNLRLCVRQLQLYRELLIDSAKPVRGRVPGIPDERLTLAEIAANKGTLIDAKLQVFDALTAVVQSCQDIDRSL